MKRNNNSSFIYEQAYWTKGLQHVAGIDEVGRGAFAGPVVAAAVILPSVFPSMDEINDSKLLSAKKREELAAIIIQHAVAYAISEVSVEVINQLGIGKATQEAFRQTLTSLTIPPQHILIDAFYIDDVSKDIQTPIIHGDQVSISIAAASIIAKVYRDALMSTLPTTYSMYNFSKHKGYGTKEHQQEIKEHGLSDLHRTSFNLTKFLI